MNWVGQEARLRAVSGRPGRAPLRRSHVNKGLTGMSGEVCGYLREGLFSLRKQQVQRPWGRILPGMFQDDKGGWVAEGTEQRVRAGGDITQDRPLGFTTSGR